MTSLYQFISGAVMAGAFVAAVFFFRFRAKTGDSLFTVFGLAFVIFGVERILLLLDHAQQAEKEPLVYLVRFAGFAMILVGIAWKNRRLERSTKSARKAS